jgi:hypothetical protein
MDATLTLTLSISILVNILTLRWAYREYIARKRFQQETRVLQQALRGVHADRRMQTAGLDRLIIWLILAAFLLGLFWWSFL